MLLAIIIGFWFNKLARVNNANQTTWVIVGIVSFIVGQIIAGFIAAVIDESLLDNKGVTFILGVVGGLIGIFGAKFLLEKNANNKKQVSDDEIIDAFIE